MIDNYRKHWTDQHYHGKYNIWTRYTPPPVVKITNQAMVAEQRMWLCVLLKGIAETSLSNVGKTTGKVTEQKRREAKVAQAIAWMGTDDFLVVCSNAGVDAKYARQLSPDKAQKAYEAIMEGRIAGLLDQFTKENDIADRSADSD